MRIFLIVKDSGENFIRHYYKAMNAHVLTRDDRGNLPFESLSSLRIVPDTVVLHPARNEHGAIAETARALENYRPDVVLFEWANDMTAIINNSQLFHDFKQRYRFKTVIRIHDHEVSKTVNGERRADRINWRRVDAVWFINRQIKEMFERLADDKKNNPSISKFRGKTFFLPNTVDPAQFCENISEGGSAGLLSLHFRHRKRIDRVVLLAEALPEWTFYVRVELPRQNSEFYGEFIRVWDLATAKLGQPEASKSVTVDGTPAEWRFRNLVFEHRPVADVLVNNYYPNDLKDWYADKAVILSTSDHEGFHYAIAEGMLSGCFPVVWNWPTARDFWGAYVVDGVNEAVTRIMDYDAYKGRAHRAYVKRWFSPGALLPKLYEKLEKICNGMAMKDLA